MMYARMMNSASITRYTMLSLPVQIYCTNQIDVSLECREQYETLFTPATPIPHPAYRKPLVKLLVLAGTSIFTSPCRDSGLSA